MKYEINGELSAAACADLAALYVEAKWDDKPASEAELRRLLAGSFAYVCAYEVEKLVGFARCISDGVSDAYLQDVVVSRAHRRRGIGKKLVLDLAAHLKSSGIGWIALVGEPGTDSFYLHCGFDLHGDFHFFTLEK